MWFLIASGIILFLDFFSSIKIAFWYWIVLDIVFKLRSAIFCDLFDLIYVVLSKSCMVNYIAETRMLKKTIRKKFYYSRVTFKTTSVQAAEWGRSNNNFWKWFIKTIYFPNKFPNHLDLWRSQREHEMKLNQLYLKLLLRNRLNKTLFL